MPSPSSISIGLSRVRMQKVWSSSEIIRPGKITIPLEIGRESVRNTVFPRNTRTFYFVSIVVSALSVAGKRYCYWQNGSKCPVIGMSTTPHKCSWRKWLLASFALFFLCNRLPIGWRTATTFSPERQKLSGPFFERDKGITAGHILITRYFSRMISLVSECPGKGD